MSDGRALNRRDHLIGAGLCVAYVLLLVGTAPDLAMSRDESFYVHAAKSYATWVSQLFSDPTLAFERESIDRAWAYNWEHPAWMKLSFAWSWLAQKHLALFPNESLAFRFPGMLTAGLLLWLIYAWGASVMRRQGALFAALAFALMPRVFYHSHLACFDIPIAFFITLTAYTYWRALADSRWVPFVGLAFGLALGVALVLAFDYLGTRVERASEIEEKTGLKVIGQIPRLVALMIEIESSILRFAVVVHNEDPVIASFSSRAARKRASARPYRIVAVDASKPND